MGTSWKPRPLSIMAKPQDCRPRAAARAQRRGQARAFRAKRPIRRAFQTHVQSDKGLRCRCPFYRNGIGKRSRRIASVTNNGACSTRQGQRHQAFASDQCWRLSWPRLRQSSSSLAPSSQPRTVIPLMPSGDAWSPLRLSRVDYVLTAKFLAQFRNCEVAN